MKLQLAKLSRRIQALAVEMDGRRGMPSAAGFDWSFPKATPQHFRRRCIDVAGRANTQCERWARELAAIARELGSVEQADTPGEPDPGKHGGV